MKNATYSISGMHCASCANIIERQLSKLEGIESVTVNFATETAYLRFDEKKTTLNLLNKSISKYGYRLISDGKTERISIDVSLSDQIIKAQFAFILSLLVFIFMIWETSSQVFPFIPQDPLPMEFLNKLLLILATIIMFWIGKPFILAVARFLRYGSANMDTLIGIGTLTAYLYSVFITLFPQGAIRLSLPTFTYFDITIVVVGFITLGKYLENASKKKTADAISKLLHLQAKTALVLINGKEKERPISEVVLGDTIIVKPGAKIPLDGKIIEGSSSIDESAITGESIPVDKTVGDQVIGGTINKQGYFIFQATRVGSDTMLSQIVKMVELAQNSKAPIQRLADRISSFFVPAVLVFSLITLIIWLTVGNYFLGYSVSLTYGILSFFGILIIACPCALGLATPTAIIAGVGLGAENGILIKDAESLEKLGKIKTVVFDKTGTLTHGKPIMTDILTINNQQFTTHDVLQLSASLEQKSEHPLALAIVEKAKEEKIKLLKVSDFSALEGVGVKGQIDGQNIIITKPAKENYDNKTINTFQNEGKTVITVKSKDKLIGIIALSDTLKPEAEDVIKKIKQMGITPFMITGDNQRAALYMAKQAGIEAENVIAEVLPQEKAKMIKKLRDDNLPPKPYPLNPIHIAFIGDGINDAPALATSDVGIAMASGTDIAIESSDITLLSGNLVKLVQAIKLSQKTIRTIKQNLFWAFVYNTIGIPIAAGLLYPFFGVIINPVFASLAMSLSSISVVTNSLLLKRYKL
jgi:Cu2+-exporting ATPase/Cu+-exporting ATPase